MIDYIKFVPDSGESITIDRTGEIKWINIDGIDSNQVTESTTQTIGSIGKAVTNSTVSGRTVAVTGFFTENILANREKLLAIFLPRAYGKLIVSLDGTEWWIYGTATRTPAFNLAPHYGTFDFTFTAQYPYWRTVATTTIVFGFISKKFFFPRQFIGKWPVSVEDNTVFREFFNQGSIATDFEFEIIAETSVTNPQIYHTDQKKEIKLILELYAGESVKIKTGKQPYVELYRDGLWQNGYKYLENGDGLGMTLQPGKNILRFYADRNTAGMRVNATTWKGEVSGL